MTKKVKIKFLVTRVVQDGLEGTDKETKFEAGKTYSLEPASADRWVKRKVAEFVQPGARRRNGPSDGDGAGNTDSGPDAAGDGGEPSGNDGTASNGESGDSDSDTGDDNAGEGGDLLSNTET